MPGERACLLPGDKCCDAKTERARGGEDAPTAAPVRRGEASQGVEQQAAKAPGAGTSSLWFRRSLLASDLFFKGEKEKGFRKKALQQDRACWSLTGVCWDLNGEGMGGEKS